MREPLAPVDAREVEMLEALERKVLWLSTYTIHHANKLRHNPDQIKVGGHQASTASVVSLLTALMFRVMRPEDRLALKPHSSPAYHAIQALLGNLPPERLRAFREFGGIQSYPSRRSDTDGVHFNTGSVGLGGVNTMMGSVVQEYVQRHFPDENTPGRYISLMGDAEMEEGTLHEALMESRNYRLRDCWWIIDLNRQSLDKFLSGSNIRQMQEHFTDMGWHVIVLKYSRSLIRLFEQPGGEHVKAWLDDCSNAEYQTLLRVPPEQYKETLLEQIGGRSKAARKLIERHSGEELRQAIMHLGGHDMHMICEAFDAAARVQDRPVAILAYTVKGWGLPLAGHKDNHSGLLSEAEIEDLRQHMHVPEGREFDPMAGFGEPDTVQEYLGRVALHRENQPRVQSAAPSVSVPASLGVRYREQVSTQGAFGQIVMEFSRVKGLGERVVTTAPDVALSTNLGGWINRVGIYQPEGSGDIYEQYHLKSPFRWKEGAAGRHIELGIAENNFFSLLGVLGMSYELTGSLLFPIGTIYDVFLKRGLDMLTNAIYSESRFILVGTPSGVTLAPEGGAHQSFLTPLLGLGFPELDSYEPSYARELEWLMCWAVERLQNRRDGRSVYLRLSTNPLSQPELPDDESLRQQVIAGGYWLRDYRELPDYAARPRFNLLSTGVMTNEALRASDLLAEDGVYANVIQVTSADRLYKDWKACERAGLLGEPTAAPYLYALVPEEERHPMVSVIDGHPLTLQWIGEALGTPQIALGVTEFGESGDIESLYRTMHIHCDDIVAAVGRLIVEGVRGRGQARPATPALDALEQRG